MQRQFIPPQYLNNFRIRSRGYLPHWEVDDAFYSITYRLDDSLPAEVICELRRERERIRDTVCESASSPTFAERMEVDRLFALSLDGKLDRGYGRCHLSRPDVAAQVADNLKFHDGNRHELHAWAIMPNHVHAVIHLVSGTDLDRVLHSWKSYTGKKAARMVGLRRGRSFWQKEYFDRLIRDKDDLDRTIRYVVDNPAKAGLKNWPWVWRKE